ncbi:MAG: class I SAM-dependent methyltransferase [Actinomycetota bacterium]
MPRPAFPDVLASVAGVEGWMSDDQARRLYDRSSELGAGARIVEIGSFRGRSMIVLASVAADDVAITAIDPHLGSDRGPQEIEADHERGDDDFSVFHRNLESAGVDDRVRHVRKMSDAALADVEGEIDLLYIDGAHRFAPARADIVEWGNRVSGGGTMLIHDSFSSIGVTLALLTTTFVSGRWRYVGRSRSMAEYQRANLSVAERLPNLLRQVTQLPWFVRNVVIKVLIVAKLGRLTRLLGHRNADEWPY